MTKIKSQDTKDRALFLDIDGVLNSHDWTVLEYKKRLLQGIKKPIYAECDPLAVALLSDLVVLSHATIIISSAWRQFMSIHKISEYLETLGFNHAACIVDATPVITGCIRGAEIDQYLQEHPEIKHYCILDDDSDMLAKQRAHFVRVSGSVGLTQANVLQCLTVLDRDIL